MRVRGHAVALDRQPVRPQVTHLDHGDIDAVLSCYLRCYPVVGTLLSKKHKIGDAVSLDEPSKISPPGFAALTSVGMPARSPPENLVAGIEVDPQTAMAACFQRVGDLCEDRRGRPLEKQKAAIHRRRFFRALHVSTALSAGSRVRLRSVLSGPRRPV